MECMVEARWINLKRESTRFGFGYPDITKHYIPEANDAAGNLGGFAFNVDSNVLFGNIHVT